MQTQTQTSTPASTPSTPAAPVAKVAKSITVTLRAKSGPQEIIAVAYKTKAGWRSELTFYAAKAVKGERRSGQRGNTQNFTGANAKDEAKASLDAMVAFILAGKGLPKAIEVKGGWVKPEPKPLGLERKPDAFTLGNLPKPASK